MPLQSLPHDILLLLLESLCEDAITDIELADFQSLIFSCKSIYAVYSSNRTLLMETMWSSLRAVNRFTKLEEIVAQRAYLRDPEVADWTGWIIPMGLKSHQLINEIAKYSHGQNGWDGNAGIEIYNVSASMYAERESEQHGFDMAEFDNMGREYCATAEICWELVDYVKRQLRRYDDDVTENEYEDLMERADYCLKRVKNAEKGAWMWAGRLAVQFNKHGNSVLSGGGDEEKETDEEKWERLRRTRMAFYAVIKRHPKAPVEEKEE